MLLIRSFLIIFVCVREVNSQQPLDRKELTDSNEANSDMDVAPVKSTVKTSLNHKVLIEKIREEREKFIQEKKSQMEAEKQAEIDKLVNSSKVDDTGAKGITGGEPSDKITLERRNSIKKVSYH